MKTVSGLIVPNEKQHMLNIQFNKILWKLELLCGVKWIRNIMKV